VKDIGVCYNERVKRHKVEEALDFDSYLIENSPFVK
jgi:hypothetical protein